MQKYTLISIVIPVYNTSIYLEKCINTVINQTYSNLEIIIVDDGSTDNSAKICEEFSCKDNRIKVIHQKNSGLSAARNTGIKNATGDYILFIDSDDYIDLYYVEKLEKSITKELADIAVCGIIYFEEESVPLSIQEAKKTTVLNNNEQMRAFLTQEQYIPVSTWTKMYKRSLFNTLRFPVGKYHEDIFTTYKLLDLSQRTVVIPEALYWYRQRPNSIMNSSFNLHHMDALEATIEQAEFIKMHYFELKNFAYASIVYTACVIYKRMIESNYYDNDIESELNLMIKKHIKEFLLFSKSALKTKLFAICSLINMAFARKLYRFTMIRLSNNRMAKNENRYHHS